MDELDYDCPEDMTECLYQSGGIWRVRDMPCTCEDVRDLRDMLNSDKQV